MGDVVGIVVVHGDLVEDHLALGLDEGLERLQRRDARFFNSCMMATALGAAVSDGLEDGRVVSREDLLSDVWDTNWFGSTKTLDVHVGQLRRKLEVDPKNPRYLQTVRGVGYMLAPD